VLSSVDVEIIVLQMIFTMVFLRLEREAEKPVAPSTILAATFANKE
jgi:hypothetical protein